MKTSFLLSTLLLLVLGSTIACTPRDIDQPDVRSPRKFSGNTQNRGPNQGQQSGDGLFAKHTKRAEPLALSAYLLNREAWVLKALFETSSLAKSECLFKTVLRETNTERVERWDISAGDFCTELQGTVKEGRLYRTLSRENADGPFTEIKLESEELWWSYNKKDVRGAFVDLKERIKITALSSEASPVDWQIFGDIISLGEYRNAGDFENFNWRQSFLLKVSTDKSLKPLALRSSEAKLTADIKTRPFKRLMISLRKKDSQTAVSFNPEADSCFQALGTYSVKVNGGPSFKGELTRGDQELVDKKGTFAFGPCKDRSSLILESLFIL